MNIKDEVSIVLDALQAILNLIEQIDPNAKNNIVFIEIQKVISILKSLGL